MKLVHFIKVWCCSTQGMLLLASFTVAILLEDLFHGFGFVLLTSLLQMAWHDEFEAETKEMREFLKRLLPDGLREDV